MPVVSMVSMCLDDIRGVVIDANEWMSMDAMRVAGRPRMNGVVEGGVNGGGTLPPLLPMKVDNERWKKKNDAGDDPFLLHIHYPHQI